MGINELTFDDNGEVAIQVVVLGEGALVHASLVEGDVEHERLAVGLEGESLIVVLADHDTVTLPSWRGLRAKFGRQYDQKTVGLR